MPPKRTRNQRRAIKDLNKKIAQNKVTPGHKSSHIRNVLRALLKTGIVILFLGAPSCEVEAAKQMMQEKVNNNTANLLFDTVERNTENVIKGTSILMKDRLSHKYPLADSSKIELFETAAQTFVKMVTMIKNLIEEYLISKPGFENNVGCLTI